MLVHPLRSVPHTSALLACLLSSVAAEEDGGVSALIGRARMEVEEITTALATTPDVVRLYSRRGDAFLFLNRPAEAVADFEKMIALDPSQDAPHWRLGIAYYFAGQFEKSAQQFAKYHAYDGRDRENGIWKFLAQSHVDGLEKARREMLVYTQFDREPFPALYAMFAGQRTTDEVFQEIEKKGLTKNGAVMFFAHYYGGLNEALLGHRERALELTRRARESAWGRTAEGGPAYMWQVARVHADRLASSAEPAILAR